MCIDLRSIDFLYLELGFALDGGKAVSRAISGDLHATSLPARFYEIQVHLYSIQYAKLSSIDETFMLLRSIHI